MIHDHGRHRHWSRVHIRSAGSDMDRQYERTLCLCASAELVRVVCTRMYRSVSIGMCSSVARESAAARRSVLVPNQAVISTSVSSSDRQYTGDANKPFRIRVWPSPSLAYRSAKPSANRATWSLGDRCCWPVHRDEPTTSLHYPNVTSIGQRRRCIEFK